MKQATTLIILIFVYSISSAQTTYTFNGNGNWSDSSNWLNKTPPPSPIPNGVTITINPIINGECIINIPLKIPASVNLNIQPSKKIRVLGDMSIQYDSTVVLKDNVRIVENSSIILTSNPTMLSNGIYEYTFVTSPPPFDNGDILLGSINGGYLRKISSSVISGNKVTYQTSQGNLEDVFKQGYFSFNLKTDSLLNKSLSDEFIYLFDNVTLLQEGPITIKLKNGNINMNPDFNFKFDFSGFKISSFEVGCQNATFNSTFELNITASQQATLLEKIDTLKRFSKTITKLIPAVILGLPTQIPVVIELDLDFIAKFSAALGAHVSKGVVFNSANTMSLGIKYKNNNWEPYYVFNSLNSLTPTLATGNVNATVNLSITPTFGFKLYGVVGPYIGIGLKEQLSSRISPDFDWDFSAGAWVNTILGANASALGYSLFNFSSKGWNTDTIFFKTPESAQKISGDNQEGNKNEYLPSPIKVQIRDNLNLPQSNVQVYFSILAGNGSVETSLALTDSNGYAETRWKLGTESNIQYLEARAKKGDGTTLRNIPIVFKASIRDSSNNFTDPRDGQVYPYKTIGSQIWMTKNLNYNAQGSLCYGGSSSNCEIYGRLYDWNTAINVAPKGWHIPTREEWQTLISYLGGEDVAAGKMKSITGWDSPNEGATNSSGFTGLPAGARYDDGTFSELGERTYWWSSTPSVSVINGEEILTAFNMNIEVSNTFADEDTDLRTYFYSIRCIKDN